MRIIKQLMVVDMDVHPPEHACIRCAGIPLNRANAPGQESR
jgi:hypothetical protein